MSNQVYSNNSDRYGYLRKALKVGQEGATAQPNFEVEMTIRENKFIEIYYKETPNFTALATDSIRSVVPIPERFRPSNAVRVPIMTFQAGTEFTSDLLISTGGNITLYGRGPGVDWTTGLASGFYNATVKYEKNL